MFWTTAVLAAMLASGAAVRAPAAGAVEEAPARITKVQRIFVDRLSGGETASQIRDMIISSLQASGLFSITENPDHADATLRGSAEDLIYTDTFISSEGLNARGNIGSRATSRSGSYAGAGVGDNDSTHISERRHEASASVRLVDKEGDVIWATTQESRGGKFRGASADVAEKIARQLVEDCRRAKTAPRTLLSR
jgi:hypothetical protein